MNDVNGNALNIFSQSLKPVKIDYKIAGGLSGAGVYSVEYGNGVLGVLKVQNLSEVKPYNWLRENIKVRKYKDVLSKIIEEVEHEGLYYTLYSFEGDEYRNVETFSSVYQTGIYDVLSLADKVGEMLVCWSKNKHDGVRDWYVEKEETCREVVDSIMDYRFFDEKYKKSLAEVGVDYSKEAVYCKKLKSFLPNITNMLMNKNERVLNLNTFSHGDMHGGNIMVREKGKMLTLIDFPELIENSTAFYDECYFEVHLIMDNIVSCNFDEFKKICENMTRNMFTVDLNGVIENFYTLSVLQKVRNSFKQHFIEDTRNTRYSPCYWLSYSIAWLNFFRKTKSLWKKKLAYILACYSYKAFLTTKGIELSYELDNITELKLDEEDVNREKNKEVQNASEPGEVFKVVGLVESITEPTKEIRDEKLTVKNYYHLLNFDTANSGFLMEGIDGSPFEFTTNIKYLVDSKVQHKGFEKIVSYYSLARIVDLEKVINNGFKSIGKYLGDIKCGFQNCIMFGFRFDENYIDKDTFLSDFFREIHKMSQVGKYIDYIYTVAYNDYHREFLKSIGFVEAGSVTAGYVYKVSLVVMIEKYNYFLVDLLKIYNDFIK